uniref:Uncharacterized protein n=1 Tax=Arundo donax TaxID=35708 RepID=A0A0A9A5D1_ARUDO
MGRSSMTIYGLQHTHGTLYSPRSNGKQWMMLSQKQ